MPLVGCQDSQGPEPPSLGGGFAPAGTASVRATVNDSFKGPRAVPSDQDGCHTSDREEALKQCHGTHRGFLGPLRPRAGCANHAQHGGCGDRLCLGCYVDQRTLGLEGPQGSGDADTLGHQPSSRCSTWMRVLSSAQ